MGSETDSTSRAQLHHLEVDKYLFGRRTISKFKDDKVAPQIIESAIEIARWAPNHHLTQPWHFYVLGAQGVEAVCQLIYTVTAEIRSEDIAQRKAQRARKIPAWVVVTSKHSGEQVRDREDYAATCCAIHNFSLHLWGHGIGMKWCTGDLVQDSRFYELMGIESEHETVVGILRIGYPAIIPKQKRLSPEEITTWCD